MYHRIKNRKLKGATGHNSTVPSLVFTQLKKLWDSVAKFVSQVGVKVPRLQGKRKLHVEFKEAGN